MPANPERIDALQLSQSFIALPLDPCTESLVFEPSRTIDSAPLSNRHGEALRRFEAVAAARRMSANFQQYFSMPFKFLTLEVADRVATLTVNRPTNSTPDDATIAELGHAIDEDRVNDAIAASYSPAPTRSSPRRHLELSSQTPVLAKARAVPGQDVFRRIETCPGHRQLNPPR